MPPSVKLLAPLSSEVRDLYDLDRVPDDAAWSLEPWVSRGATWYQVKDMLKMVYPKDSKNRIQCKLLAMMKEMQSPEYDTESSMEAYFPMHLKVYDDIEKICVTEQPHSAGRYGYNEWLEKHIFEDNASNLGSPRHHGES